MATSKKRINVTLPDDIEASLEKLADRDQMPVATKASYLIKLAIEIDEDDILNAVAENRDTKDAKFLKHNQVW